MMGLFFVTEKSSLSSKLAAKAKSVIPESPEKKTVLVPDTPIAKQVRHSCVIDQYLSLDVRKSAFCICENKDADQLRSNCAADQCLCFCFTDSTIPLLPNSEFSSL